MAASGRMPRLEEMGEAIAPGAQPIVAAIDQFVSNPKLLAAQLANRDDVFIYGNEARDKMQGAEARDALAQAMKPRIQPAAQGIRAALTPDGQVGFAAYNLVVGAEMNDTTIVLPYRVMEVFVSDGGAWKLVQLHFAHCVGEEIAMQFGPPPAIPDTRAG